MKISAKQEKLRTSPHAIHGVDALFDGPNWMLTMVMLPTLINTGTIAATSIVTLVRIQQPLPPLVFLFGFN